MSHQLDPHHDASPIQEAETVTILDDQVHELKCHLQRSIRYHKARERFFDSWSNFISFASLLAGSGVVVSLLAVAVPEWVALASGAMVAALQALEQVSRLSLKARTHSDLAASFVSMERILTMRPILSEADLREAIAEVLLIEAREPPIKRYLDLICHNQVARSIGSDDVEELTCWQRWFAQYFNGDSAMERATKG